MVAEVAGRPVPPARPPVLRFDGDGRVTGTTGVNRLAGAWALASGVLTLGPLAMTRRAGPPARMAVESALVSALEGPLAVARDGDGLRLGGADGVLLRPLAEEGPKRPTPSA